MSPPRRLALLILFGLVGLGLGVWVYTVSGPADPPRGYTKLGGDFTLQSNKGPVSLSDFKGKLVALYFGYTHCPDICPTSLLAMSAAFKQLAPDELEQVQGVFISVDPERDTSERLAEYTAYFHPGIIGLTGSLDQLREITKRYGAIFQKVEMENSAMDYAVDHTSTVYIIGRDGIIQKFVTHSNSPDAILAALKENLAH